MTNFNNTIFNPNLKINTKSNYSNYANPNPNPIKIFQKKI